jgi:glycine oxidase
MSQHAIIIGGGIIGLSSAWTLLQHGWRVTVLDAAPEAREASWAAAGMLAPHHEADEAGPLWRLGIDSLQRWPLFVEQLGVKQLGQQSNAVDLHVNGGLMPLLDDSDAAAIEKKKNFLSAHRIPVRWLERRELTAAEPAIAATCQGALLLPGGQVNPRLMCTLLQQALSEHGGVLRYHTAATNITERRVTLATGEHLDADEVILASGAWTPHLAALSGVELSGEPVKGQMLRLRAPDGLLNRFVHCHHAYLVPRRSLGLVVGATMVMAGFDRSDDPAAIERLAAGARRLIPALADAPVVEQWTGLRPRLNGGLPIISRFRPGLIVATGHFRNGILLAPITAAAVHSLAAQQSPPCDLTPFTCPLVARSSM